VADVSKSRLALAGWLGATEIVDVRSTALWESGVPLVTTHHSLSDAEPPLTARATDPSTVKVVVNPTS
jgi:hypothetical protein